MTDRPFQHETVGPNSLIASRTIAHSLDVGRIATTSLSRGYEVQCRTSTQMVRHPRSNSSLYLLYGCSVFLCEQGDGQAILKFRTDELSIQAGAEKQAEDGATCANGE